MSNLIKKFLVLPVLFVLLTAPCFAEGENPLTGEGSSDDLPSEEVIVSYTTSGISDSFLIQANLQLVSTLYDNRADFVIGNTVSEIPTDVKSILSSYKTMFI